MDGRGRLGTRNWDLGDHSKHSGKMLKSVSGVSVPNSAVPGHLQETSLRMSSYPLREPIIDEHNSHAPAMDFSWFPQRTFIAHSERMDHHTADPATSEVIGMHSMPLAEEDIMHNDDKDANPPPTPKVKKRLSACAKKSGCGTTKVSRTKEPKKQQPNHTRKKGVSLSMGKREKKNQDSIAEGIKLDLSSVPVPVCSCTGVPRQCYRWGAGGWQSSCCTTSISEYPLPMSPSRPGARLAGRKMSIGAYGKLLQRLAAEGYDLSYAVDLKDHWARHGTNKFVTIR